MWQYLLHMKGVLRPEIQSSFNTKYYSAMKRDLSAFVLEKLLLNQGCVLQLAAS
jgi:hypothetical protein